jgi:phage head maturation protease
MAIEIRALQNAELRASANGKRLEGYAVVYGVPSRPLGDLGGATEVIRQGAFRKSFRK